MSCIPRTQSNKSKCWGSSLINKSMNALCLGKCWNCSVLYGFLTVSSGTSFGLPLVFLLYSFKILFSFLRLVVLLFFSASHHACQAPLHIGAWYVKISKYSNTCLAFAVLINCTPFLRFFSWAPGNMHYLDIRGSRITIHMAKNFIVTQHKTSKVIFPGKKKLCKFTLLILVLPFPNTKLFSVVRKKGQHFRCSAFVGIF